MAMNKQLCLFDKKPCNSQCIAFWPEGRKWKCKLMADLNTIAYHTRYPQFKKEEYISPDEADRGIKENQDN